MFIKTVIENLYRIWIIHYFTKY